MYNGPGDSAQIGAGGGGGDWIGALIGAGASLYDSYQNRKTSKENTDKTIAANKAEAELAYQRQLAMWEKQNMYNLPENQMARWRSAGLSPHLIYGQGNPGNASAPPAYNPPNIQYAYKAGNYGAAVASILPTIMSVGSWVQDMRLKQTELEQRQGDVTLKKFNAEKLDLLIDQLRQKYPMELKRMENDLSLFPYQESAAVSASQSADLKVKEMIGEMEYKYGQHFSKEAGYSPYGIGGVRAQQLAQEAAKTKIQEAKASWTDFNITDPQALIMMALNSVMGLAGSAVRAPRSRSTADRVKRTHMSASDRHYTRPLFENPKQWWQK